VLNHYPFAFQKKLSFWALDFTSYICIIYIILFNLILFINNYYQYRRSPNLFKKMFTRNCCSSFVLSFLISLRIFRYRFQFGDLVFWGFGFTLLLCSSSLSKFLLWLRSSALIFDGWCCSIYIICALFSYLLCICFCIRIFLYSSIVCFALFVNVIYI